jgi:hypothetical protein
MKHSSLLVLTLLGIILMGAIPAGAASGAGPYYATPSWDQTIPASTRFVVLTNFDNEAVLDRETGLVWARTPFAVYPLNYNGGVGGAINALYGKRGGWRLPTISELSSLLNFDSSNLLNLPTGHPFILPSFEVGFWSSTAFSGEPGYHHILRWHISGPHPFEISQALDTDNTSIVFWAVRGPE